MESIFELFCNLSGIYSDEGIAPAESILDLSALEGTECYCSQEASMAIRLVFRPFPYTGLHWIDSGDYHYLTLFWLEKIERNFVLILFDNHSDDIEPAFGDNLLSCGSWVKNVRNLPFCKEIHHIKNAGDIPELSQDAAVYLSIDKDVLSPEYARTDWDQGDMTLDELMASVADVASGKTILGIDVCGGLSLSKGATGADISINRRTDRDLRTFLKTLLITGTNDD